MFLFEFAFVSFLVLFGQIETHWVGEEYWTIIDWNGAISDGRSIDDFLEIPGPDGGTRPNGWVAYWITRTKYRDIHYEAFGHAIKRDDGRICGYFVGKDEEIVEVCAGFRILSRHRNDRADAKVFQWVLAGHVTNRDETVGFVLHRIASTRHGEQVIYGDAMLLDRQFKGVRPAVFDNSLIKIGVHDFTSRVYLLVKLTPEVGPVRTGHYEGHYHDPHTNHRAHGRNGHPLPIHRPRAVEPRSAICTPGWYGRECSDRCSDGCEFPESCDYTSGYCSKCKQGWYGSGCSLRCSDGCERCDQNTGHCLTRSPPSQPQALPPLQKGCRRVLTSSGREFVSCDHHRTSNTTSDDARPRVDPSDKRLQDPRANPASSYYDPIFDPRSQLYDPRYNPFDPQYDVEKDREWRAANGATGDQSGRS